MKTTESIEDILRKLINQNGGQITPAIVLAEAKRKSSPLHTHFTWDDTQAAHQWRLEQAAHMIRKVRVTVEVSPEVTVRVRAFMNVAAPKQEDEDDDDCTPSTGVYVTVENAMKNHRDEILSRAMSELNALKNRYAHLKELAAVWEAVGKV